MGGRERCGTRPRPSPDGFGRQQRGRKHGARGGVARQETTCTRRSGAGVAVARDECLLRLEILCPLRRGALSYGTVDEMDVRPIYDRRPGARRNSSVACQRFAGRTVRPAADTDRSGRKTTILRDEGEAMGRRLDEAGVETTTYDFNGVIHDWECSTARAVLHRDQYLSSAARTVRPSVDVASSSPVPSVRPSPTSRRRRSAGRNGGRRTSTVRRYRRRYRRSVPVRPASVRR